jgi:hypothetical protein
VGRVVGRLDGVLLGWKDGILVTVTQKPVSGPVPLLTESGLCTYAVGKTLGLELGFRVGRLVGKPMG